MTAHFRREGPIAIVMVSEEGYALARNLAGRFPQVRLWGNRAYGSDVTSYGDSLKTFFGEIWTDHAAIIAIMASGIVVRSAAPWVSSKYTDPAVVVVDDVGRFAISLLSGHEGEANALAQEVATALHSIPVITTGTEARRRLIVGVGCRRGVDASTILAVVDEALSVQGHSREEIYALATIDLKADEPGLIQAAAILGAQLRIVPRSRIRAVQDAVREPSFAEQVTGVASVCVPAAILASPQSELRAPRLAKNGVTVALAEDACGSWALAPAEPST